MVMGMQSLNIALYTRAMEQREAATGLIGNDGKAGKTRVAQRFE